jgi:hypothetical protein
MVDRGGLAWRARWAKQIGLDPIDGSFDLAFGPSKIDYKRNQGAAGLV